MENVNEFVVFQSLGYNGPWPKAVPIDNISSVTKSMVYLKDGSHFQLCNNSGLESIGITEEQAKGSTVPIKITR